MDDVQHGSHVVRDAGLQQREHTPVAAQLLEEGKRGDPCQSSCAARDIARQMARLGFRCGKDAIARLMREDGWSLQGMAKVLEGTQHPDRDAQFEGISAAMAEFRAAGDPMVSVDIGRSTVPAALTSCQWCAPPPSASRAALTSSRP
jgi:hypothetical protein